MKILLAGNPNVGKSVVFSRLTGVDVLCSNYPGTTVSYCQGSIDYRGEKTELIDTPGAYSLDPRNRAEEVTAEMLAEGDVVINVVDATNLERNLYLTLQLIETGKPVIVALNMWDCTKHLGIHIDAGKLEKHLGVPIVPTVAVTGEGVKELVDRLPEAKTTTVKKRTEDERWIEVGSITSEVQAVEHKHHTLWETLEDATIKPTTGLPLALLVIYLSFSVVRFIGETLIGEVFNPLFELYRPLAMGLSGWLGPGLIHDIVIGNLIEGEIEFMESMGLLTTGVYVPFAAVLPYIIAFYFVLALLEDSGYLPRLSTLVDNLFHLMGMHGHGIVPVFLGLGCNVPGALSIRTMESRKQRFISATLLAICVPCMAQTAMVFGILGPYGMKYICIVFVTLIVVYILGGLLMNRLVVGESPEIFLEVPPYRMPRLETILKKTWIRVRWFLTDAIPWLFFGIILVNILYLLSIIDLLGRVFAPIVSGLFGLPKEAVAALLVGFLRKDLAVGMLLPLGMTPEQLTIAAVILTMYFPCTATFAVLVKELGVKDMMKSVAVMLLAVFIVGGLMKFALIGL